MKEYRGTDIIKASRFLQKMAIEREELEKIIPLTKVQVEDRFANVYFEGEHDGKLLTVIVTVYRAMTYCNKYFATTDGRVFQKNNSPADFLEMLRWINSICKLDTEEARNGTLVMRREEWAIVHADFIEEFIHKLKEFAHNAERVLYGVMVPWEREYKTFLCQKHYPILTYDPDIHDFKSEYGVATDSAQIGFLVSYDAKKIYLIFGICHRCDRSAYEFTKKLFPDSVPALPCFDCNGEDGSARMIECNSIDEVVEKMKYAQDTWEKHYDEIAKEKGITRDWKKADEWDYDGPSYPEGTPERESLEADKRAKEEKRGVAILDKTLRGMSARGFDFKTMFPYAEITYEKGDVVVKIKYQFPKIDGSKLKWKSATCDIRINFYRLRDNREEFKVKVQDVATYQTMHGVYDWFKIAKTRDPERMMIIKPGRARHSYYYYDGYYCGERIMREMREAINSILPKISELKEFAEYKRFKE